MDKFKNPVENEPKKGQQHRSGENAGISDKNQQGRKWQEGQDNQTDPDWTRKQGGADEKQRLAGRENDQNVGRVWPNEDESRTGKKSGQDERDINKKGDRKSSPGEDQRPKK